MLTKCHDDETTNMQNAKLMKQHAYKMPVDKMPNCQNAKFIKCQVDETASLQNAS
jgi:hypothetical protein